MIVSRARSTPAMVGSIIAVAFAAGAPRSVRAQPPTVARELERIDASVTSIGVKLQTLVDQFRDTKSLSSQSRPRDRYANAEILFLLGDYQRASLVLLELARAPEVQQQPYYTDLLYYLAESQFQIGNDIAARQAFEDLVERRANKYLQDAIRRLIQIADRNQQWEGLDAKVAVLRGQGALPPAIAYITAKSLVRQRKYAAVEEATSDIATTHPLWGKGRYLLAVAQLLGGDIEGARQRFEELLSLPDTYENAAELRELAAMNRARIFMEAGELGRALDGYQSVSRHSKRFEEALYEVTWGYVRAASQQTDQVGREREYQKALKSLEILLLSEAETTLAPEARLLLGNVLLRLARHQNAEAAFREVVQRYQPVREELQRLSRDVTDPVTYYQEVAERSRQGGGVLPPLALKWAAEERQLRGALEVVKDLDDGDVWIDESQAIIDKLLAVLGGDDRASFFPELQQAQLRRQEMFNSLVALLGRLLAAEREALGGHLDADTKAELQAVLAERAKLEPDYLKLPQTKEDYDTRLGRLQQQLRGLEREVYRLKWLVEEQRRNLAAMNQFVQNNLGSLGKKEAKEVRERLDLADKEVGALEAIQKDLEKEVERERSMIVATNQAEAAEQSLRARYAASLEREREILQRGRDRAPPAVQALVGRIDSERERITSTFAALESFRERLGSIVAEQADSLRNQLSQERDLLVTYRESRDTVRTDAKRVVGEIAIASLNAVERKFKDIVLRGDVGVIDVAWALKDDKTQSITERVEEQRRELQVLDSEFAEVLADP